MARKLAPRIRVWSLAILLFPLPAFAEMVHFDFDAIQSPAKKGIAAPAIEAYMESLYGFDVSVSLNTAVVRGRSITIANSLHSLAGTAADGDAYLTAGKGKGLAGITIDFGDNPIESFSVDFQLFKKAKNFAIVADGVVVDQHSLSKAQRKKGLSGQTILFFDEPVEKLQFVGSKKKSIGIDNLVINIAPEGTDSSVNESGVVLTALGSNFLTNSPEIDETVMLEQVISAIPEPSSLLLLGLGLGLFGLFRKRL